METDSLKLPRPELAAQGRPFEPKPARRRSGRVKAIWFCVGAVVLAAAVYMMWKAGSNSQPLPVTVPTVAVAKVARHDVYNEVPIPAEFRPYVESELHAMVTGYVQQMNVDFGDKVKQGQVLATLEVPELTDELRNAQAAEQQAEADHANAHLIYTRLLDVNRQSPHLVAQQDIDTAQSKDASTEAAIAAAKADVEKYQTLIGYTKIIAPFDGVITQRSADPGALVQAGTSSDRSMPLLRISDNYRLRLDFPVSVDYVKEVKIGDLVTVRVDSLGGKTYTGRITRFTDEVNDETRTMITEMEVDNPNLEIVPGMYAVALFKFDRHPNALSIPTQAVVDPKNPVVDVVDADHQIEARTVTLGVEMPDQYEVIAGLRQGDLVMVAGESQVHPGERVEPKLIDPPSLP